MDRLILGVRTQEQAEARAHEPVCRLLVERLKWMTVVALLAAILGAGIMWELNRREAKIARQQTAEIIASQCVDRAVGIAFRNLLVTLTVLNEKRPPLPPAVQRRRTGQALREALKEAGPPPSCILKVP